MRPLLSAGERLLHEVPKWRGLREITELLPEVHVFAAPAAPLRPTLPPDGKYLALRMRCAFGITTCLSAFANSDAPQEP